MLVLKMVKKYINICKYKLSPFGRDDTKQAKSLISIAVTKVEQFPKVQKKKKKKKKKAMLDVVRTCNNSSYNFT